MLIFSTIILSAQPQYRDTAKVRSILTSLLGEEGRTAMDYLTDNQLIDSFDLRTLAPNTSFVEILGKLQAAKLPKDVPMKSKTQLSIDQYYLQHDTLFSGASSPWTTQLSLQQEMSVAGLPFTLSGNGILSDRQLDRRRSGVSFNFDAQKLIIQHKQAYQQQLAIPKLWAGTDNLLDLSEEEQNILQNEVRFQFYQYLITHPSFSQTKIALDSTIHSLHSIQDSIPLKDLQIQLVQLQQIEQQYRQHWDEKSNYLQTHVNTLQQKTTAFLQQLKKYDDPQYLKQQLLKRSDLSIKDKLFILTRRFDLGRFHLSSRKIAVKHLVLNGLHYQIEQQRWFAGVAWGRQSFTTNFLPNFNRSFFDRFSNNQALYLKAGIGTETSNHLQVNILHMKEGGERSDSIYLYPKRNVVFTLAGQQQVGQDWHLVSELAFADHDLVGTNLEGPDGATDPLRMAGEISLAYRPSQQPYSLAFGAFYTGPRFISLGNPFLLTNRQGVLLKLGSQVSKKLQLDLDIKYGQSIGTDNLFEGELSDLQIVGGLQWQLNKNVNVSLKIAPNTFKQSGAGEFNVSNNNSLYHLQTSLKSNVLSHELQSIIGFTNYRSNFSFYDTTALDQFNYLYLQESLSLSDNQSLNITVTLGSTNPFKDDLTEVFSQVGYGHQKNNIHISLGGQFLQDRFEAAWRYGISSQLQWRISRQFTFGLDINYQTPISGTAKDYILGHTQMRMNL